MKAKALKTLYRMGKIDKDGLLQAVESGVITAEDYTQICGDAYGA